MKAQKLGLNTCRAAFTHGKSKAETVFDEKEVIIIALGYGKSQGKARKSKAASGMSNLSDDSRSDFGKALMPRSLPRPPSISRSFDLN